MDRTQNEVTRFTIDWKDTPVEMQYVELGVFNLCKEGEHDIGVMHHTQPLHTNDSDGDWVHWCPTMFLYCYNCGALGHEPEPYECERWGV